MRCSKNPINVRFCLDPQFEILLTSIFSHLIFLPIHFADYYKHLLYLSCKFTYEFMVIKSNRSRPLVNTTRFENN